jgi:hypothetical protein
VCGEGGQGGRGAGGQGGRGAGGQGGAWQGAGPDWEAALEGGPELPALLCWSCHAPLPVHHLPRPPRDRLIASPPPPCPPARRSWIDRCIKAHSRPTQQNLFAIIQGGLDPRLRALSLEQLIARDTPGFAIGGLAGGESKDDFWRVVSQVCATQPALPCGGGGLTCTARALACPCPKPLLALKPQPPPAPQCTAALPADKPRYVMGIGYPLDIVVRCAALLGGRLPAWRCLHRGLLGVGIRRGARRQAHICLLPSPPPPLHTQPAHRPLPGGLAGGGAGAAETPGRPPCAPTPPAAPCTPPPC